MCGSSKLAHYRQSTVIERGSVDLKSLLYLSLLLVVGFLLRFDFLSANHFVIDSDEAIVGLMAKHIAEGKEIPTFYYGQHYMGSLEPLCVSVLFKIFGVSAAALKMVPLIFSLFLIFLVFQIGKELSTKNTGLIAATLCALPPVALVVWSAMARGGFIEIVVLGAWAILRTIRWVKSESRSLFGLFGIALILGLGWWVNNQIIYFILPIGFVVFSRLLVSTAGMAMLQKLQAYFRTVIVGSLGFFIGGLPFWVYNFKHDFASFGMFGAAEPKDLLAHLIGLFSTALPILIGGKRFWGVEDYFPGSALISYLLIVPALITFLFARRTNIARLFILKIKASEPNEILLLLVLSCIAVFSFSSFGYLVQAPRYLLPLYVALFVLIALGLERIASFSRPLATLNLCAILTLNIVSCYLGGRAIPGEPFIAGTERVAKDQSELIRWLTEKKYSFVRTNYWIGYRLAFETEEKVRFIHFQAPQQVRIESYVEDAKNISEDQMPLVLGPEQGLTVKRALRVLGYTFKEITLSGYTVLYEVDPVAHGLNLIPASEFSLSTSDHQDSISLAVDGDLKTRWGSGRHQAADMQIAVSFSIVQEMRGFEYELGQWQTDFPRTLNISLELESGEVKQILNSEQSRAVDYYKEFSRTLRIVFAPMRVKRVILSQVGADPVFDWSVAELRFFR